MNIFIHWSQGKVMVALEFIQCVTKKTGIGKFATTPQMLHQITQKFFYLKAED